jgi:Raf kinase inhibitor-like YbhB/YbcL family protein
MKLVSPNFKNNEKIPVKFTKDGENVNPELTIKDIPENAKSLVLIVDDPDAQRVAGYTWIHWIIFNIPVDHKRAIIKEKSIPGIPGENSYKRAEYGGPNPPARTGIHHYHFKAYAIDKELDLKEGASLGEIQKGIQDHLIDETELIGIYFR